MRISTVLHGTRREKTATGAAFAPALRRLFHALLAPVWVCAGFAADDAPNRSSNFGVVVYGGTPGGIAAALGLLGAQHAWPEATPRGAAENLAGIQGLHARLPLPPRKRIERARPGAKAHSETWLPDGWRIEGAARCEVKFEDDRLMGRSEGSGGHLYARRPPGLKVLRMLVIDGQTYAPGASGDTLIIPLPPREHTFEIRALEQPAIFRNRQVW